jgi:hypothetical protein
MMNTSADSLENEIGTKVRRRGGVKVRVGSFRYAPYRRNVGASMWTADHGELRIPARIEAHHVRLYVVHNLDGVWYLRRYRCEPRVSTDGYIHVGPDTMDALYNLSLSFHDRTQAGYLHLKHHPLETRVAARLSQGLEAVINRQIFPEAVPSIPEPSYGFRTKLPMQISQALKVRTKQYLKLPYDAEPTEEQMQTTWDEIVPLAYIEEGERYFLYAARYVVPKNAVYDVHPRTKKAPPEVAPEKDGVKFQDWVGHDGRWIPAIMPGATVMFDGRSVAGHEYENPAFGVLQDAGIIDAEVPFSSFVEDIEYQTAVQQRLLEMDAERLDILIGAVQEQVRPNALCTVNDVQNAIMEPTNALLASEEPRTAVFYTKNLVYRANGWDLDLQTVPRRFSHILVSR